MNAHDIQAGCNYWIALHSEEVQVTTLKRAMSVSDGWICNRAASSDWIVIEAKFFLRQVGSGAKP